MSLTKLILTAILLAILQHHTDAQIIINEASNKNSGQISDEDGEFEDWIELYNQSENAVNLSDYYLSDDSLNYQRWKLPAYNMQSGEHLLIFASGKNRTKVPDQAHWESPVLPTNQFDYLIPTENTSANWKDRDFSSADWSKGKAGFGYGDNDDNTVLPSNTMVVYLRKSFNIPDGFNYNNVALQVDYDDGFVAYLNGTEIARANISGEPGWNTLAAGNHEATMYSGGAPETIQLDTAQIRSLLVPGENVFAIEAHNVAGSSDFSLIPYLSFRIGNAHTFFTKTPSTIIPSASGELHTNFKINSEGERIFLFNPEKNYLEKLWVRNLQGGWSLGRTTDGADNFGIFIQPTPGTVNTGTAYPFEREPEPYFSVSEGYYTGTVKVSLSTSSSTAEIRYTRDGSEPTKSSTLFSGTPINVTISTVIRATCFSKETKLPSRSVSNTYLMNKPGYTLPVLSVITDNANLYGSSGIFDNWMQEWEKPCYVEYFGTNKRKEFEQFSGIQIDGGAGGSRSNAQHSFRLEFDNNNFGDGNLEYKLIPDRPERDDYKSIYLRNGSNQWLTFQFKDAMECKMMANKTNNYYSACTPVIVFINASYFGVYEMREKLNDDYFKHNYKATIDSSFHLLSLSYYYNSILRALNGSVDTFTTDYNRFLKLNPSTTNYLTEADKILDLDYYTDYIAAQTWIADTDWPFNNIKIVKGDFTNHRWRFILQDLEWSLNPNGWTNSGFDHINYMINYSEGVPYLRFWKELMKNATYKKRFLNRLADLMNSSYLPENTTAIAQEVYDRSYAEMRDEYVRWGGGESQANTRMMQYANNLATFKSELNARSNVVRYNVVSNYSLSGKYSIQLEVQPAGAGLIQVNSITPDVYPWNGIYFSGIPIKMEAKAMGNYVFDGWEANPFIKNTASPVIEADPKVSGYKFVAKFKLVRPETAVTISEINYSSGENYPAGDWIELLNYGDRDADITGWFITDSEKDHQWIIPRSVILKPNQRVVLASNLNKFRSVYPAVTNVLGSFDFGLGTPTDSVQLFDATGKLIAGLQYSTDAPWPTEANNLGKTLELKNPDMGLNMAANWFAGCEGGSPGTDFQECDNTAAETLPVIAAARIFPNPASDLIHVVFPESASEKVTCTIFDLMGKQVKTETGNGAFQNMVQIPVDDLQDGIYLVQVTDGPNRYSLKFVKRR